MDNRYSSHEVGIQSLGHLDSVGHIFVGSRCRNLEALDHRLDYLRRSSLRLGAARDLENGNQSPEAYEQDSRKQRMGWVSGRRS